MTRREATRRLVPMLPLLGVAAFLAGAPILPAQEAPATGQQEPTPRDEKKAARKAERKAARAAETAATPEAETQAAEPAVQGDLVSETPAADERDVRGWLLISTDAAATVRVDNEPLGTLEPGDTLRHGIETLEAEVVATAVDLPTAVWRDRASLVVRPDEAATSGDAEEADDFRTREGEDGNEGPDPAEGEDDEAGRPNASSDDGASVAPPEAGTVTVRRNVKVKIRMLDAIEGVRKAERRDKVWPEFETGLMWSKQDNRGDVTWAGAKRFCEGYRLGGFDDWRLPTIDELATLQAMWSQATFKTLGPITVSACCPWSVSEVDDSQAWNYNFRFRRPFEGQKALSYDLRALCVRTLTGDEIAAHEEARAEAKRKKKKDEKKKDGTADQSEPPGDPILDPGDDRDG